MAEPAVSVVIPAYNREGSLTRAMQSVLSQTFDDLELIVVDDASTDATVEVARGVADPRVRVFRHATNRRAAAARNTGIRAARGRYVAFLDSDDEWFPDKLAVQVAELERAPADVRANCAAYEIVRWGEVFPKVPEFVTFREILMGCDLAPTTLMVRRDVFTTVGLLDESFGRYEDWDWVLRYAKVYRVGITSRPLARLYRGGYPPAAPLARDAERFLAKHADDLAAQGPLFARKVRALRWFELAEHYYRQRDLREGTAYLVRGFSTWPWVRPGMYVLALEALLDIPLQSALWRARRRLSGGEAG